jgi:hypothetical protein
MEASMWWSSRVLPALGALLAAPVPGRCANGGRLDLLAREAADAMAPVVPPGLPGGPLVLVGAILVAALLASVLGTWIGLRSRSVARIRERDGWRELSYRFRSADPLKADANLIGRMATVLDDLEDLGRRLKTAPGPALRPAGGILPAEDIGPPVRFRRSGETEGVRARWTPPPSNPPAPPVDPPVPAARPQPIRPRAGARPRAGSYDEARRLLREGMDRESVRARTGLKAAEIDLLRCAPGGRS